MTHKLPRLWHEEYGQDIAEISVGVGCYSGSPDWYHPTCGLYRQPCIFRGCEFNPVETFRAVMLQRFIDR